MVLFAFQFEVLLSAYKIPEPRAENLSSAAAIALDVLDPTDQVYGDEVPSGPMLPPPPPPPPPDADVITPSGPMVLLPLPAPLPLAALLPFVLLDQLLTAVFPPPL